MSPIKVPPPPPYLIFETVVPYTINVDSGGAWTPVGITFVEIAGKHWCVNGSVLEYDDEIGSEAFGMVTGEFETSTANTHFEIRSLVNGIPETPVPITPPHPNAPIRETFSFGFIIPTGGPFVISYEARKVTGPPSASLIVNEWEGYINGRWTD